jgi:hypothetical protein
MSLLDLISRQVDLNILKENHYGIYLSIYDKLVNSKINRIRYREKEKIKIQNDLLDELDIINDTTTYINYKKYLIRKRRLPVDKLLFLKNNTTYDNFSQFEVDITITNFLNESQLPSLYRYKRYLFKDSGKTTTFNRYTIRDYSDFLLIAEFGTPEAINETLKHYLCQEEYRDGHDLSCFPPRYRGYIMNGIKLLFQHNTVPIEITNIYRIKDKETRNMILSKPELYPKRNFMKTFCRDTFIRYNGPRIVITGILLVLLNIKLKIRL